MYFLLNMVVFNWHVGLLAGYSPFFSVTVCLTGDSLCDLHGGGPRGSEISESGEWLPGASAENTELWGISKCTSHVMSDVANA